MPCSCTNLDRLESRYFWGLGFWFLSWFLAKFSSTTDFYSVVKAEFVAMRLAKLSRLQVAEVEMTSAYDICPQGRSGNEATQAMLIGGDNRMSRVSSCLDAAHQYLLSPDAARAIVCYQLTMISDCWNDVCQMADLNETDRRLLWGRQFLNPFAFEDLSGENAPLKTRADEIRNQNAC